VDAAGTGAGAGAGDCIDAGDSLAVSNVNQATANADYGIIESYNLLDSGASEQIFVANQFFSPGFYVAVAMVTTGNVSYEMVRADAGRVGDTVNTVMAITVENLGILNMNG
jgi:hypothetical protein